MKSFIRTMALMSALAALMITADCAYADSFNFAFSGVAFSGTGVSASGTITTNPLSNGSFLITSISGTQNGSPISLIAPGQFNLNDNLLFPSAPFLDGVGVSYYTGLMPNGQFIAVNNIEYNTTDPNEPMGYILVSTVLGCGQIPISFSVSPSTVPEPATLILFGSGIFAVGAAWRRKRLK